MAPSVTPTGNDFFAAFIQNGCLSVNLSPNEELAQKRQDLLNKNTIRSENIAMIKSDSCLKACQIKNYEDWVTFCGDKSHDLLVNPCSESPSRYTRFSYP